MRFLLLARAPREVEARALGARHWLVAADRFTSELVKAGVLLAWDALEPSTAALSVRFPAGERPTVGRGAVGEAAVVIGFWLVQVRSASEVVELVGRWPPPDAGAVIEIREVRRPAAAGRDVAH